jgi:hypothetical protein
MRHLRYVLGLLLGCLERDLGEKMLEGPCEKEFSYLQTRWSSRTCALMITDVTA